MSERIDFWEEKSWIHYNRPSSYLIFLLYVWPCDKKSSHFFLTIFFFPILIISLRFCSPFFIFLNPKHVCYWFLAPLFPLAIWWHILFLPPFSSFAPPISFMYPCNKLSKSPVKLSSNTLISLRIRVGNNLVSNS